MLCSAKSCYVVPCCAMLYVTAVAYFAMLHSVVLCCVMLCCVVLQWHPAKTKCHGTTKIVRYSEDPVITNYLVNNKNIRYSGVTKLNYGMYTTLKTVYRLAHKQLHLNKAKLWRSKFPYLDHYESCLAYQPFVSSCRFYLLRTTGQNIRYSGVNCALGPSKSIPYSRDFVIAGISL